MYWPKVDVINLHVFKRIKQLRVKVTLFYTSIVIVNLLDLAIAYFGGHTNNLFAFIWVAFFLVLVISTKYFITDFKFENLYFKTLLTVFLIYEISIILRGFSFSQKEWVTCVRDPYILWPFFIPLFVFFDKTLVTIIKFFNGLIYLGLFFFLIAIFQTNIILERPFDEQFIFTLTFGCAFLLLLASYLKAWKINIAFIVVTISILALIFAGRRTSTLVFSSYILVAYLFNLIFKSRSIILRGLPLILGLLIIFVSFNPKIFKSLTKNLDERLLVDSRSELIDMFFLDMKNDMLIGHGMNGKYYYPMEGGVRDDGMVVGDVLYRNNIENGYLQLILSGGIIHIILIVAILLPASILGLFYSKNQLSGACGVVIFLYLINLFSFGLPELNINYILVWISVGICYKKSFRLLEDNYIAQEFKKFNI